MSRQAGDQRRVSIGDRGGGGGSNIGGRLGQRGVAGRLGPRRGGGRGRGQIGLGSRMETFQRPGMPVRRQSTGSAFSRLGSRVEPRDRDRDREESEEEEEDEAKKPTLQSSVVATAPVVKSREDTVKDQQKDTRGQARNKRMFGLLLGTLHKFKQEATHFEDKNVRRAQIEQKLDQKAQQGNKPLPHRERLFNERREKQREMVKLEDLMTLANEQEAWDEHTTKLSNFICTKTKPRIFYMPKTHTSDTKKKLAESKDDFMGKVKQRKEDLNKELEELENERNRRKERIEQREREEKENVKAEKQIRSYDGYSQRRVTEGKDERHVSETHDREKRRKSEEERAGGHHKRRRTRSRSDDTHKRERSDPKADMVGKEEVAVKKLKQVAEEKEEATTTSIEGMESSSGKTGKYEGEVHDGEGQSNIAKEDGVARSEMSGGPAPMVTNQNLSRI
ncbi:putative pinin-like [Apostichopus japonicus]|uniref:Pinin n=1 Tax=Stichopus japonicus TaxID=307972 RepID=A0A2G8LR30_STIJA|nr:putative pinin-like [Apostichopus japonicus]